MSFILSSDYQAQTVVDVFVTQLVDRLLLLAENCTHLKIERMQLYVATAITFIRKRSSNPLRSPRAGDLRDDALHVAPVRVRATLLHDEVDGHKLARSILTQHQY